MARTYRPSPLPTTPGTERRAIEDELRKIADGIATVQDGFAYIVFEPQAEPPRNPKVGTVYLPASTMKLVIWTGSAWTSAV